MFVENNCSDLHFPASFHQKKQTKKQRNQRHKHSNGNLLTRFFFQRSRQNINFNRLNMNNSSDLFDPEHADMDDIAPPIDFNAVNKGVDLHYEPIDDLLKGAVSIASASHHLMSCHDTYMEKEYINYDHFTNSKQVFLEDDCLSSSLFPSSSAVMIPAAPFVLLVTSFRCSMGNDELGEC